MIHWKAVDRHVSTTIVFLEIPHLCITYISIAKCSHFREKAVPHNSYTMRISRLASNQIGGYVYKLLCLSSGTPFGPISPTRR